MLALKEKVLEVGTEPREAVLTVLGVEGGEGRRIGSSSKSA